MNFPRFASLLLPVSLMLGAARAELAATFEGGGATDVRADRLPALLVKAGESPTPFLPAGEFGVTWKGTLVLAERQRLAFSFEGEGKATLTIDGEEVLAEEGTLGAKASKSTRLNRGDHEITITFRSKPDGSGRFRLFWEEHSFPKQSVPPAAFKAEVTEDPARKGRLLFAENHCSKCHLSGVAGMQEMMESAPLLFSTGSRLNEEWLAKWIADPSALRADTRMPALVDASTAEGKQQAADLAAWLMTLKAGEAPAAPDKALAQKGGEHFHRLGCAACHTSPGASAADATHGRVPLHNVADKFQPGALVAFLKKPDALYPHIGMPDFALSDAEANEIAAFVLDASSKVEKPKSEFPKGDATKGAALAQALNCGACHAGAAAPSFATPVETIFTKDWSANGCVSGKHGGKVPKLALNDEERAALIAFSKKGTAPLSRHVPAEYAAAKVKALRCTSCHGMDGKPSLLDATHVETKPLVAHVHGENEKLDQSRPHLTYIGEMLYSSYMEKMINGAATPRPRPWLDMRMPAFHGYATDLAKGLACIHGVEPGAAPDATPDASLAEIGKKLASLDGFGCTTCHGVGPVKPSAAFEVEGVNFALSHERLRKEWFDRWMDNPPAVTPGSKMPRYSDEGKSQRPELDGDAQKQFDAIWNYIQKPQ
ncbi:c-type cytochrome [Luteolibacter luteus]|uniref:C-type cytochrome n=1 Tax=Luteolibacter luteus TaxID=2728835 RepID=A0A858RI09_9BACT|nr:c-type cytochrome [Luteolibacter luteus]QJE95860.1 c-type cytochrome [Luteolibacter luteus]